MSLTGRQGPPLTTEGKRQIVALPHFLGMWVSHQGQLVVRSWNFEVSSGEAGAVETLSGGCDRYKVQVQSHWRRKVLSVYR